MPLCLLHIAPKVPAWIYCTADEWSSSISALVFVGLGPTNFSTRYMPMATPATARTVPSGTQPKKKRPIFSAIALFELETTEKKKKKEEGSMAACFTPDNDLRIQLGSTTKSNLRGNLFFGRVSPRLSIHFFCFRCFLFCLFAY